MQPIRFRCCWIIFFVTIMLSTQPIFAESVSATTVDEQYLNSVDFSPLSPLFQIYALQYYRHLSDKSELVLGVAYTNIHWDFGNTDAWGPIIGYRRFLWKKLHIEYQLWPTWDNFYEKNEDKYYYSFDLWNEFRLGYQVDFTLADYPCFINFQWPFGFGLYAENKPQSFKNHEDENPYFYFPPMFFLGLRF